MAFIFKVTPRLMLPVLLTLHLCLMVHCECGNHAHSDIMQGDTYGDTIRVNILAHTQTQSMLSIRAGVTIVDLKRITLQKRRNVNRIGGGAQRVYSAYFIHVMPKIGGAKAPSAHPVPTPMPCRSDRISNENLI